MRPLIPLLVGALAACGTPPDEPPLCGDSAAVCEWLTTDPLMLGLNTDRVGWVPACAASAEEARAVADVDGTVEVTEAEGWYDLALSGSVAERVPKCSLVEWTSFPEDGVEDHGTVDGLPVVWELVPGVGAEAVEDLVYAVEASWSWRHLVQDPGYVDRDEVYALDAWIDDFPRWRFCRIHEQYDQLSTDCHDFVLDTAGMALAASFTTTALRCEE